MSKLMDVILAVWLLRAARSEEVDRQEHSAGKDARTQSAVAGDPFAEFPPVAGLIWALVALTMYVALLQEVWSWARDNRAPILGAASAGVALIAVTAQMTEVRYDRLGKRSPALRCKLQARMWTALAAATGASALALRLGVSATVCAVGLMVLVIAPPALSYLVAREGESARPLVLLVVALACFVAIAVLVL